MTNFHNRVRVLTSSTGTGTIALGQAAAGYASFQEGGVPDGGRVTYCIEDGNNFEVGNGVYSSGGQTLTRPQVLLSKINGEAAGTSPLSLSGSARVFLTASAEAITDLGAHFSVRTYGAIGNGSTNDHTAFQAAVAAADASLFIKTVYVPHSAAGYVFGDTVVIPEGVTIRGDNLRGLELSRIKPAAAFSDPLFETEGYGVTRVLRIALVGLFLDGSATTLTAVRANCQESLFHNLTIKNCFTYGLHIGGVGSGATEQALNNHITDNYLAGIISTTEFFDGIFIDYNSADNTITGNYIEASKDAGIRSRGYNNKITNNHVYGVSGTGGGAGVGIYIETAADHDLSSNYIENCAAEAILMAGGGSDVGTLAGTVHGNTCRNIDTGNTSNGVIEISGSDVSALTVFGNVVRRDAATSYATPYFVYFNGITPTRAKVFGNEWQASLIATAETNVVLPFDVGNLTQTGYTDLTEISEPSNPSADAIRLFARDVASRTELSAKRSDGTVVDLTANLTPIFILATGQSNFQLRYSFSWTPAENVQIWNNTPNVTDVGTQFITIDDTEINVTERFASEVARANPGREVYLLNVAFGGREIAHWMVGASAPDAYDNIVDNIVPALAAAGVDKIDVFLWWQGESDASSPTGYIDDFETVIDRFKGEDWFPISTPIVVYGNVSTAINGNSIYGRMNNYYQAVVNRDPERRMFVYTPGVVPASQWADDIHIGGAGHSNLGYVSANSWMFGQSRPNVPGFSYDQENEWYAVGIDVIPDANAFFGLTKNENGFTVLKVTNPNTGSSANAGLVAVTNHGQLLAFAQSTAAGGDAALHWTGNGTLFLNSEHASGDLIFRTGGLNQRVQITAAGESIFTSGNSTTQANYVRAQPSNWSAGNPYLTMIKFTGATHWGLSLWDGSSSAGIIDIGATAVRFPNITTTASAANAFLDGGGNNNLLRSTSSLRYKSDVEDLETQYADRVLDLRPVWYRSTCETDPQTWSWYGLIAEEVAEIDPRLVHWTYPEEAYDAVEHKMPDVVVPEEVVTWDQETGKDRIEIHKKLVPGGTRVEHVLKPDAQKVPDGVMYDRLAVLLLDVIQRQERRIAALEARVATK